MAPRKRKAEEEEDAQSTNAESSSDTTIKRPRREIKRAPRYGESNNDKDSALSDQREDEELKIDDWFDDIEAKNSQDVERDCKFEGQDAKLIISLKVYDDPEGLDSRKGYQARIQLIRNSAHEISEQETGKQDTIGYIQSWRIHKPETASAGERSSGGWKRELLRGKDDITEALYPTSRCLQALYNSCPDGRFKGPEEHADAIKQEYIMYIEMIYIKDDFQKKKLLRPTLEGYYEALRTVTGDDAFSGTLVLIPSKPEGIKGKCWGDEKPEDVMPKLTKIYERLGFEIWEPEARTLGGKARVMGRQVPS